MFSTRTTHTVPGTRTTRYMGTTTQQPPAHQSCRYTPGYQTPQTVRTTRTTRPLWSSYSPRYCPTPPRYSASYTTYPRSHHSYHSHHNNGGGAAAAALFLGAAALFALGTGV